MSGHGHVTPNADGSKARCGGPGICYACSREMVAAPRAAVKTTARLVDELTSLLYQTIKSWPESMGGPRHQIVQCEACRKKGDKPESVVHESDCPVHRLWQAMEVAEVVVKANAEEICDLEDARDALEAKVNALTAEMECRNQLTSRIAALEAENARLRARAEAAEALCERFDGLATDLAQALPASMKGLLTVAQLRRLQEDGAALMKARAALAASAGEG